MAIIGHLRACLASPALQPWPMEEEESLRALRADMLQRHERIHDRINEVLREAVRAGTKVEELGTRIARLEQVIDELLLSGVTISRGRPGQRHSQPRPGKLAPESSVPPASPDNPSQT